MKHLNDGTLRRMLDEPQIVSAQERLHLSGCASCSAASERVAADARYAADALDGPASADAHAAWQRMRAHSIAASRAPVSYRVASAAGFAAVVLAALLLTPLGGYAGSLLTIFEPRTFEPIQVSRTDLRQLRLLPQAQDVGTQHIVIKPQRQTYDSIAAAQRHVDFTILRLAALPRDLPVHSYTAMTPGILTYTFSAAKARAFEQRSHKQLPPMPAGLDGTTVRLQTGYVFHAHFESADAQQNRRGQSESRSLVIVEARVPRVTSTGASLDDLERYLLVMPNVSPELASQIRALGDIENTVPVPVMLNRQTARRVTVHGTAGLAIGDNTGLGAGVVWQNRGIVYLVAGPLSMDEVMNVADGLR